MCLQQCKEWTKNGMHWLAFNVQLSCKESGNSFCAVRLLQLYAQHIIKQNIKSIFYANAARQYSSAIQIYMPGQTHCHYYASGKHIWSKDLGLISLTLDVLQDPVGIGLLIRVSTTSLILLN